MTEQDTDERTLTIRLGWGEHTFDIGTVPAGPEAQHQLAGLLRATADYLDRDPPPPPVPPYNPAGVDWR